MDEETKAQGHRLRAQRLERTLRQFRLREHCRPLLWTPEHAIGPPTLACATFRTMLRATVCSAVSCGAAGDSVTNPLSPRAPWVLTKPAEGTGQGRTA